MRQVMPHRNNIVADRRRCKTFLRPMSRRPLNPGDCGIWVWTPSECHKVKLSIYNNDIKRYS